MGNFATRLGMVFLLGIVVGIPNLAFGATTRQIEQQERLVSVLLGRNQALINQDRNVILRENLLESELPGKRPAQQAQIKAQIAKLNIVQQVDTQRLITSLQSTSAAGHQLEQDTTSNPIVARELQIYLQKASLIFASEIQQADLLIKPPPSSPTSFNNALDPYGFAR